MMPLSKHAKHTGIIIGVTLAIAIACKLGVAAFFAWPLALSGTLTVLPGQGASAVANTLAREFSVPMPKLLTLAMRWQGIDTRIAAGRIDLSGVGSISELLSRLDKPISDDLEITILEGWTIRDIAEYGKAKNISALASLATVTGPSAHNFRAKKIQLPEWVSDFTVLASKPDGAALEGYLFPDTYRILKDATADDIAQLMLQNFSTKVDAAMIEDARKAGRSLHEIIIMASILEREVQTPEDMAKVSDLFWRRLGLGMALQADSTVNYVTGGKSPSITIADTKLDSLFNTYKYSGLPLGPIGNPGLAAIRAAIYPTPNDALYFLTDKEGNVHYARTFEQHIQNKDRYLR